MGHVQPGGAASGARADETWALWRALIRHFPVWSLLPSSFTTPGAWGYLGVDFLTGFRANPSTHRAFEILAGADDALFDGVSALASLNARRHEQMLRAVVIAYLTVPISILALAAEVAGDGLLAYGREHIQVLAPLVAGLTLAPLGYFLGHWRSRQIVGVLDLIRIERGQSPFTALELREE
jgi:hypothetical protein